MEQLLERLRLAQARREGRITDDELQLAIHHREYAAASPPRYRRVGALLLVACIAAVATAAYF